jgi:hypothetical protein
MNTIYKLTTNLLKSIGLLDPHEFEHNYKFQGFTTYETSIPYRNEKKLHEYQYIVRQHLKQNLLGYDYVYIRDCFHHPVATMESIITTFRRGDLPDHVIPKDKHYFAGFTEAIERFRPPQLVRPVHFADLRHYKWNWHPNVEEPFYSDKELKTAVQNAHASGLLTDARMSFHNLKNVVFIRVRRFLHQIKRGQITNIRHLLPIMKIHVKPALTAPDEIKIRVIFGVSKMHVLPQAMFFWPLFRYYIDTHDSPMLWGFETILGGMQKLHALMSIPRLYFRTYVTVDWSGFDLRALHSMCRDIFKQWRTFFDFANGYIPTKYYRTSTADPQHLENLWSWVMEASLTMPFQLPDKSTYTWNYRGIGSGLFITQFLDSQYNLIMILTILDAMGFEIKDFKIFVQGDDSLQMLTFHIPSDQHDVFKARFQALASHYFDHIARADKTHITNDPNGVEVLGYTNWNGYPRRDWRKLLAQLLYPRGSPSMPILMARCCGIQYASMYDKPEVTQVCKGIYNHLHSLGIQPAKASIQRDVILQGEATFEIPTDHFPTEAEVTAHLRTPYVRTEADREEYFPRSHFLSYF